MVTTIERVGRGQPGRGGAEPSEGRDMGSFILLQKQKTGQRPVQTEPVRQAHRPGTRFYEIGRSRPPDLPFDKLAPRGIVQAAFGSSAGSFAIPLPFPVGCQKFRCWTGFHWARKRLKKMFIFDAEGDFRASE